MPSRTARVRAYAKINLDLRVLHKRPDNFHELRTIFQTISLADTIELECERSRVTSLELDSAIDIPNNLVLRAAQAVLDSAERTARVRLRLHKVIPMGGGLGGGSTDAAAILLALPPLLGIRFSPEKLLEMGAQLGSDVPFFLLGGTALGLGRGTELYPLPEAPAAPGLVVAPHVHVSTPAAFQALGRSLTSMAESSTINTFQCLAWSVRAGLTERNRAQFQNDFEAAVFQQHPLLKSLKDQLRRAGGSPAMMTGSGAALFGLFDSVAARDQAVGRFSQHRAFPMKLLTRRAYQRSWWKALAEHVEIQEWPPRSRYAR